MYSILSKPLLFQYDSSVNHLSTGKTRPIQIVIVNEDPMVPSAYVFNSLICSYDFLAFLNIIPIYSRLLDIEKCFIFYISIQSPKMLYHNFSTISL